MYDFTDILCRETPNIPDTVQCALISAYPVMAGNKHLALGAFDVLYTARKQPSATLAIDLCSRDLDAAHIEMVLAREKRAQPLLALLASNLDKFSGSLLEFASTKLKDAPAGVLLTAHADGELCLSDEQRDRLLASCDSSSRLRYLAFASPALLDDTTLLAQLADFSTWAPERAKARRSAQLNILVTFRPTTLDLACAPGAHDAFATAAAGAPTLTSQAHQDALLKSHPDLLASSYMYMALTANPATTATTLDAIEALAKPLVNSPTTGPAMVATAVVKHRQRLEGNQGRYPQPATPPLAGPVDTVADEALLNWLFRRVLPTEYKESGRPAQQFLLARNPFMEPTHMAQELGRLVYSPYTRESIPDYVIDETRAVFARNYPELASAFEMRHAPLPHYEDDIAPSQTNPLDPTQYTPHDLVSRFSMDRRIEVLAWLASQLGESVEAWEVTLSLAATFTGNLSQLAETARAAAA